VELSEYIVRELVGVKLTGSVENKTLVALDVYRNLFKQLHNFDCSRERSLALTKLEESYLWLKEHIVRNEAS